MTTDMNHISAELRAKYHALIERLRSYGRVAVAFSGGVDSTLLLRAAGEALGRDNALGIIASSETLTRDEFEAARAIADGQGFRLRVVAYSELGIGGYSDNPINRCYFCKKELFGRLREVAKDEGIEVLADGSSYEDLTSDYRPGMKAARELGVVSPLMELEFHKEEIRRLALAFGLPNWNKPSAACLSSRFPYGTKITREGLDQVAQGESFLREKGFTQIRVRYHDAVARIELPADEIPRLAESGLREAVVAEFKRIGFRYVTLDLQGYRTGSLNEGLELAPNARVE